ncbi:MAG TPA: ExeM/NucH family extracellular endonuclease [Pseudonocardiaceae bacterium]|nr:ExeM/NucH family extracellular endonuclease [Pseudonocardiaceae bacterium]
MSAALTRRLLIAALSLSAAGAACPLLLAGPAFADPGGTGVVINEVYGGGGNAGSHFNADFIELFNPTGAAEDLTGWTVQYRAATGTTVSKTALTGSIAAHGHYLVQESTGTSGDQVALPTPDATGTTAMSATGGVVMLVSSATSITTQGNLVGVAGVVDAVGWGTTTTSFEGTTPAPATDNTTSVSRTNGVDTDQSNVDFTKGAPTPQNAASDNGGTATLTVTNPGTGNATAGTAIAPLTLAVSGGTPPYTWTATGLPAGLSISTDGIISGTPATAGTSSVTATATDSAGVSGSASFSFVVGAPAGAIVPIADIQGTNTDTSPLAGQTVTTEGVVTAAYPTGGYNGFYLETGGAGGTEADDATPGASDAVFVFGSVSAAQVTIGESVTVTGKVAEFDGMTEIETPTVAQRATALPAVVPDQIPWTDLGTDAQKETHEGELMAPQGDFTVSDNFDGNFFGSFTLASGDEPLRNPTDAGTPGSAVAQAVTAANAAEMVTLDDGSSFQFNPDGAHANTPLPWLTPTNPVRVGSAVTFHSPVILDFRFSLWNFQPTQQLTDDGSATATFSDTRTENEQPADVGGQVRIATFNVENYFPLTGEDYVAKGLGTCTYFTDRQGNRIAVNDCVGTDGSPGPRGAADAANFAHQQAKIVTGINRLGASIVSLEEIENSAKFGEPRDTALSGLVDALNTAAGSDVWAFVPSPPAADLPPLDGQDVIRTAFIYKPADVTTVGTSSVLNNDSGAGQPFSIAREPLAQGFKKVGATDQDAFLIVANHFKSKSADGNLLFPGDAEDTSSPAVDQGPFNATRVHEAADLNTFANQAAADLGTSRIFLVGDFNSYTDEDPMEELYGDGYTDLGSALDPSEHTYVFDGLEGSLDHVLASPAALQMATGADVWQINSQEAVAFDYSRFNYNVTQLFDGTEPFAASDHDPVVVGLNLPSTPVAPAWNATTVYNTGDTVTFQGSTWQALWWTQNQAPGDPNGPWQQMETAPDGTAIWTPSRIFNSGDTVTFQGQKFVAMWWTRNQTPGQPGGPWQPTS